MTELWLNSNGERRPSLLRNPQPVHGGQNRERAPLWIEIDGKRLRVAGRGVHWWGYNALGHSSISASGWECEMADGSRWLLIRDLMSGQWVGEPIEIFVSEEA